MRQAHGGANDASVSNVGSTQQAFNNIRSPRLLLYRKTSVMPKPKTPPLPTPPPAQESSKEDSNTSKKGRSDEQDPGQSAKDRSGTETRSFNNDDDCHPIPDTGRAPKYPNMIPTPPLKATYDPVSPLLPWQQRYLQIRWNDDIQTNPIINVSRLNRHGVLIDPTRLEDGLRTIDNGIPVNRRKDYDRFTFGLEHHARLLPARVWFTNTIILKFISMFTIMRKTHALWIQPPQAHLSKCEFILWDSGTKRPMLKEVRPGWRPTPSFDPTLESDGKENRNHLWRGDRTGFMMSSRYREHFHAVIVFGPERLVVPFDGCGGTYTDPAIMKVSRHLEHFEQFIGLTDRHGQVYWQSG